VVRSIYDNLRKTALITAVFFFEKDELNKEDFLKARERFDEFVTNSLYQIYDEGDSVSYGPPLPLVPAALLQAIREERYLAFPHEGVLCYGIFYEDNQGDFVIVSKEDAEASGGRLQRLFWGLIVAFLSGMGAVIFLSRRMANVAYRPFRKVIEEVAAISVSDPGRQIEIPGTKDELQDLIITFNHLLAQLSETFIIQRNFVSYVSHEFKTPLASLSARLEAFDVKEHTPEECNRLSRELIAEIRQLEETLDTLLIISDLRNRSDVSAPVRIDEVTWEIISRLLNQYRTSNLFVSVELLPEDEHLLNVSVERTQLLIVLYNLIENAVKHSDGEQTDVCICKTEEGLALSVSGKGTGIPSSGVGLSIALKILEKNHIRYNIRPTDEGAAVTLLF
jgi:signal transduction histidine kinase